MNHEKQPFHSKNLKVAGSTRAGRTNVNTIPRKISQP